MPQKSGAFRSYAAQWLLIGQRDSKRNSHSYVQKHWRSEFRALLSFCRLRKWMPGGFDGFIGHLVVNDRDEIRASAITQGDVDDRKPVLQLMKRFFGNFFGGKGCP